MKNKATTYALLAVVLILWGYIVYKIYKGVTGEDVPLASTPTKPTANKEVAPMVVDHYELTLNYRDPFLGKQAQAPSSTPTASVRTRPAVIKPTTAPIKPEAKVQESIDWSFIKFNGTMKNPSTHKMVSILLINGQQYMLGEGGMGSGVKVLKVFKDSLRISYKNINKTITR